MSEELKSNLQLWGAVILGAYLGPYFFLRVLTGTDTDILEFYGGENPLCWLPFIIPAVVGARFAKRPRNGFVVAFLISGLTILALFIVAVIAIRCTHGGC